MSATCSRGHGDKLIYGRSATGVPLIKSPSVEQTYLRWTNRPTDGPTDGQMDRLRDGRTEGRIKVRTYGGDGRKDGLADVDKRTNEGTDMKECGLERRADGEAGKGWNE